MIIKAQRLIIRPLETEDAKALFDYRSDAQVNKFQSWIPESLQEVEEFLGRIPKQFNQTGTWFQLALVKLDDRQLIGDLGIHFISDTEVELGCTLNASFQGKGFAFEAMQSVIELLKNDFGKSRFKASLDPGNLPSIKLMEKLGFEKEGFYPKQFQMRGEWVDDLVYVLEVR